MESGSNFESRLRSFAETLDVTGTLAIPVIDSINSLLQMSAAELNAAAASVFLRDDEEGNLRIVAAIGDVAEELIGLRIPEGKGIAGFVMSSAQPMTVSDAGQDESFYDEIDKKTGFSTESILATPLQNRGETIGVLEFINRSGDLPHEPFTPEEMDRAAAYAAVIAPLLTIFETLDVLSLLGLKAVKNGDEISGEIREWVRELKTDQRNRDILDIAILVRELVHGSESERLLCREVLESFGRHSKRKSEEIYRGY